MPSLKPCKAIEFIEESLNYKLFIQKMSKEKGYSAESLNHILDSLKIIAEKTETMAKPKAKSKAAIARVRQATLRAVGLLPPHR